MAKRAVSEPRPAKDVPGMQAAGAVAASWKPIEWVKRWDRNPRINAHVVGRVAKSIQEFGFGAPIICRSDGTIIAGDTRIQAAHKLGLKTVPVREMDLSEKRSAALAVADNRLAEDAKWEWEATDRILSELGADMSELVGFDHGALADLARELAGDAKRREGPAGALLVRARQQDDSEPADDIEGVLADRRRWAIAKGDSFAMMRDLPDGCVDALITDPPYSSGGMFRGDRVKGTGDKYTQTGTQVSRPDFGGDNRDQRAFLAWCTLWLSEGLRVAKQGAPACIFSDWRQLPTMIDAFQAGGWIWRGIVPWNKTEGTRPTRGRFSAQCEYVVWGSAGKMPSDRNAETLPGFFEALPKSSEKFHQTGKPVSVMREIARIVEPNGVVLDPFAGSGSTGIGCQLVGARFIGYELSDEYLEIARARMREGAAESTE